jgi:hypothetical protein
MHQPANMDLAYPLGRFQMPKTVDTSTRDTRSKRRLACFEKQSTGWTTHLR